MGQAALDPLFFRARRSAHLPFLPPDVMLLHCIAKIRFLRASYDFGPLGVNVEGVTEPWKDKRRSPSAKVLDGRRKDFFFFTVRVVRH